MAFPIEQWRLYTFRNLYAAEPSQNSPDLHTPAAVESLPISCVALLPKWPNMAKRAKPRPGIVYTYNPQTNIARVFFGSTLSNETGPLLHRSVAIANAPPLPHQPSPSLETNITPTGQNGYLNFTHVHWVRLHFADPFLALGPPPQIPVKMVDPPIRLTPDSVKQLIKLHNEYWMGGIRYTERNAPYRKAVVSKAVTHGPVPDKDENDREDDAEGKSDEKSDEPTRDSDRSPKKSEEGKDNEAALYQTTIDTCRASWHGESIDFTPAPNWGFGTVFLSEIDASSFENEDVEDLICSPFVNGEDDEVWCAWNWGPETEESDDEDTDEDRLSGGRFRIETC